MVIKYEDLQKDIMAQITRICEFLGLQVSDKRKKLVMRDADFTKMKKDFSGQFGDMKPGTLVRKGTCGEWKKYFTVEQNEWFDDKYKKLFKELDIDVEYD